MFDFYFSAPFIVRLGVSLFLVGVSALALFMGRIWITPALIGVSLLCISSLGGNSSGYNF